MTPFAAILRTAVERTPRAVGGAFAAHDGEMVDCWTQRDPTEWAILTAHYGVVLSNLEACFNMWHFGGPEYVLIEHARLDVLLCAVEGGYYALLAMERPAALSAGLRALRAAVGELKKEMG